MALLGNDDIVCAHPGCTCEPRLLDKFCGAYCEDAGDYIVEGSCGCGHSGCGAIPVRAEEGALLPEPA